MDEAAIKLQSKKLMDSFMESMKDIKVEEEFLLERKSCFREEGEGKDSDEEFRQLFLKNAPKTKGDAILANKGQWLEK